MNQKLASFFFALTTSLITYTALAQTTDTYHPVYRQFKDWVVGCTNTGSCTVQSAKDPFQETDDLEANKFEMIIEREAGAKGRLKITLLSTDEEKQQYTTLSADGKPVRADKKYWSKSDIEWQSKDTSYILALIDAIKDSKHLQWSENYKKNAAISLNGLTASLLFVDEQQKRLNTPTAFIRRGNQSESSIPAASPIPILKQPKDKLAPLTQKQTEQLVRSVRKAQVRLLKEEECVPEEESFDAVDRISQTEALVRIGCWKGAYNYSSLIFRTPISAPEKLKRLALPLPNAFDKKAGKGNIVDVFTNADFDSKDRTLSMYAKGRGLGDCGESASWQFDGKQFNLVSWHYMGTCAGSLNWIPLWISK